MAGSKTSGAPSHLRPDIGDGAATNVGASGPVLPFANLRRESEVEGIIVQVKVLTPDDSEGVRVMGVLQKMLGDAPIVVGGKRVVLILTRDNVEMSYSEQEQVANQIAPRVLQRLGIREGIGGAVMMSVR